jgi:OmpA-OmpF porin, OOP family
MARARVSAVVRALARLTLSVGLAAPAIARAQTLPSLDASTWRPSPDPEASLVLEPAVTPGPWGWNVGTWTQYAEDSVVFRNRGGQALRAVAHFVGADVTAGLGLGERASIGFDVPAVLWQNGDAPLPVNLATDGMIATTGLGDASIVGKVTVLSNDRQGVRSGFGLAVLGAVSLPTGARTSFLSDGAIGGSLRLLGEYAVGVGAARMELGYAARWSRRTWPVATADGVVYGDTIPWAIGFVVRPKAFAPALDSGDRQLWEVAGHGWLPAGPVAPFARGAGPLTPALLAVDDRVALGQGREFAMVVGAELGLDKAVGVPSVRAVLAVQWAPRKHDRDEDGVADDRDECPDLPEDRDGIQDADGCPEDDADSDGILDRDDACPLVAGVPSSDAKRNGCPGPERAPEPAGSPGETAP